MPLLYGEGNRAFIQLQEEIMKQVKDNTMFTWALDEDAAGPFSIGGLLALLHLLSTLEDLNITGLTIKNSLRLLLRRVLLLTIQARAENSGEEV